MYGIPILSFDTLELLIPDSVLCEDCLSSLLMSVLVRLYNRNTLN